MKRNMRKKKRSKVEERCCRNMSQYLMIALLPLVIVGGYFCPKIGFTVLGLITIFMVITSRRGRFYCGWLCPMGAFHERILSKVSLQKPIPSLLRSHWFRWILFALMMGFMMSRIVSNWGDSAGIGGVFRTMWIVSMSLAIGLGLYFKPRTWCTVCPMGSFQGISSTKTWLLTVDESCVQCKKCLKVCPISTYPGAFRKDDASAQVPSVECLRCSNCVVNCPKKALSFQNKIPVNT